MSQPLLDLADDDSNEDENHRTESLKYEFDGVDTLEELARRMEHLATMYRAMAREGWELIQPIDSAWLHMQRTPRQ